MSRGRRGQRLKAQRLLYFVTGNRHKFKEVNELAKGWGLELKRLTPPYPEIQAESLEEVAKHGALQACSTLAKPCFVEDAGLFVRALGGFPGPYSAYVFKTLGNGGMLKLMLGVEDRRAEFRSAVAYCEPGFKPKVFKGVVKGKLSLRPRGSRGFGFDPIFIPEEGDGRTFAEMGLHEKNELSHRARAVKRFFKWYLGSRP